ncbi:unnamed protein product [Rotaria sordida]|uniref:Uncharacterized protein n=1 Tax=Rotaria sordida TaxID=392033 RepID=A0A815IHZ0_9BILA|nr:unnamed protein product [Rotaria sordida]
MAQRADDVSTYDYIIIGGGTSGAVAARRLAENNINFSVCLLEAGPSNHDITISHIPGGRFSMYKTSLDWCYQTVPQKGCNNRTMAVPRGRLLGGCSAINDTFVTRGTKADYDRIADMGNPGWSWKEMLPFFKASETFHSTEWHQADLDIHGTDGPLHISMTPLAPISEKILESFIDNGFDYKPDMFVQGDYEGIGHIGRTVYNDGLPYNPINGEGVFTVNTFLCGPQARGTVRLLSKDPISKPIIDHAYLDNDLDVAVLAEGCRLCHEIIMKGRGTKDIIVGAWPKIISHPNDMIGWKEHVRTFASSGSHPAGTCKMAPESDPMGVVDSRLRVRNVKGLRVADISILPILNNGHPQILAYAIGEKVASMILQDVDVSK